VTSPTAGFDLYVWSAPRDVDAATAERLVQGWLDAGADPATAPFEATTDIGWFYRELTDEWPDLDALTDARPVRSSMPIVLATTEQPPARIVALRWPAEAPGELQESIVGLATKYDLVLYDPAGQSVLRPLDALAAHASATFWPRGAIRAAVVGGLGGIVAVVAWGLGIPLVSGLVAIVGGFLLLMAVVTFVHEGRVAWRARGSQE
jgi:hypothetical protein